jgi:hypothetical protein
MFWSAGGMTEGLDGGAILIVDVAELDAPPLSRMTTVTA